MKKTILALAFIALTTLQAQTLTCQHVDTYITIDGLAGGYDDKPDVDGVQIRIDTTKIDVIFYELDSLEITRKQKFTDVAEDGLYGTTGTIKYTPSWYKHILIFPHGDYMTISDTYIKETMIGTVKKVTSKNYRCEVNK